ncbi:ATPase AAA [Vulcanisaeta distributa]|uniref:AAA ATPase n=1 Tax=Vulcanisaeta distributa (strain DSM 14429 / JCM 11212 / NBRC 100878 / IC-017) TaxID=572478 RepID=E1QTV6_VULDI|nr:ATPase AAA [Vulcanisaeta distributa]ADN51023.1 AAA ATPase [Vulcanisaeta distributa DSM 14429]
MQRLLVPNRGSVIRLLGPSWRAAREKLLSMIREDYQLIAIIGRAGAGKTTLLLSLEGMGDGVFMYTDMTEVRDRDLSAIVSTVFADNTHVVRDVQERLKKTGVKGLLKAFAKASPDEVVESARLKPMETLKLLNDAIELLGMSPLVIGVDEGLLSQDDPRAMDFINSIHAFRNNMQAMPSTKIVITLLPDVVNLISKVDTPLFDILRLGAITLPDYVTREDLKEVIQEYGLSEVDLSKIEALGPLTMRQLICLMNTKMDVIKCGIDTAGEISIE